MILSAILDVVVVLLTVYSGCSILQALVDVGDKEPSFVGSRKWIGSTEVGYCLDHLLGASCNPCRLLTCVT
jgi:hypothetical protein